MPKRSAGLLMYRGVGDTLEVLLVHPGGPFWAKKDLGAWSIPKGEIQEGEDPLVAAMREFHEETGFIAKAPFLALGHTKQSGAKIVSAWASKGTATPQRSSVRDAIFNGRRGPDTHFQSLKWIDVNGSECTSRTKNS